MAAAAATEAQLALVLQKLDEKLEENQRALEQKLDEKLEENQRVLEQKLDHLHESLAALRVQHGVAPLGGQAERGPLSLLAPTTTAAFTTKSFKRKLTGTTTRDPFFSASLKRKHPMYLVPVQTLLAPSFGHFRSHEELMEAGTLVEYQDWMAGKVLFVSHT